MLNRLAGFPGVTLHEGQGVGTDKAWVPERSILGRLSGKSDAVTLGREFRQNAIVWIGDVGIPELVLVGRPQTRRLGDTPAGAP